MARRQDRHVNLACQSGAGAGGILVMPPGKGCSVARPALVAFLGRRAAIVNVNAMTSIDCYADIKD